MADDLEDEWWVESEAKIQEKEAVSKTNEDADQIIPLENPRKSVKKLKRVQSISAKDTSGSDEETSDDQQTEEQNIITEEIVDDKGQSVKKKKKKKRRKITNVLAKGETKALQEADLIDEINKYFDGKLSAVEKDELHFTVDNIAPCSESDHTPTSYLKHIIPKWKKMKKSMDQRPGSPLVLIVCSAAIRATELIRQIADFRGENCKVAKLFAKHMKVEEQVKFLKKSVTHIGVGTPNRMHALLDTGSLQLDQVKFIVLDWTWRDVKSKRLIEVKDIKTDFMKLMQTHFIPHVKNSNAKFAIL